MSQDRKRTLFKFFMRRAVFVLLCSVTVNSYSQIVIWNPDRKLTWNDFKAAPLKGDTAARISYQVKVLPVKVNIWNGKVTYKAVAQFISDSSYYLPERVNEHVLEHEQIHFDITELFARKIRKVIQDKGSLYPRNAKKYFTLYIKELDDYQERFDKETENGIKKEEQLRWKSLLSIQLKELENQ